MGVAALRILRRERGLTLDALAEHAGMTKSYLSKVERGHSTPSIAVAMNLAAALGVDVSVLFGDADEHATVEVSRAGDRLATTAEEPVGASAYVGLATHMAGKQMMPFVLHPPTTAARCTFREHGGDEFVVVLAGRVELIFPDRAEELGVGDSAYFRGGQPHYFRSLGTEPADLLAVIAADGAGR